MTQARKLTSTSVLSSALALGLCLAVVGCGESTPQTSQSPAEQAAGEGSLGLTLSSGAVLTSVSYTIIGPTSYNKTGALDVSNSTTISGLIGGIPAGSGYSITLSASTADASLTCGGSATFNVSARQTTPVSVAVTCKEAPKTGSVLVNGLLNVCPVVDGLNVSPSDLVVGASVVVNATAHDSDAAPSALSYQWTASAGTLSSSTTQNPTFTCTTPGSVTLTLKVSDGDTTVDCADSATATVTCSAPVCAGGCDDGNPCTTDACAASATCSHTTVADGTLCQGGNLKVKLLGFNDFHGQLSTGKLVSNRPVGSAGVLTSYLKAAQAGIENQTIIVHAGDHVGASPAASALLQDEPAIQWLNMLANSSCTYADKLNPACNVVGTLGNHEFDEGKTELLRLLSGGNHVSGPFLEDPYKGARVPYVSANVVDEVTNRPILPPYVIKQVQGVPIAFVGAVLEATPTIVTPTGVAGLKFLDEADAANSYVPEIKALGVKTIVLLIHQGASQSSYTTSTNTSLTNSVLNGTDILDVVTRLDSEFDVVVSGHSHSFTNVLVSNNGGKKILVTQAFSASTAYDDIDLTIDPVSKDVVSKSARIVTTFADVAPGNVPDPAASALTVAAEAKVAPLVSQVVGFATKSFTRDGGSTGESSLGDIIADSQNIAEGTQFAFMNPGGIRADLVVPAGGGNFTWNDLFTIQPFGNTLVKMNLTGAQIKAVLEQQWTATTTRILQISGFGYTYSAAQPIGSRIVEIHDAAGVALDPAAVYSITCNNFLATGGDGFTAFVGGTNQIGGPVDLDALIEYTEHNNPLPVPVMGRIIRQN
ncbi:MAG TPA: 5'-nucleotidase C-terminal domain-containing protein [Polyangiaceae bacterium]|nr:5'-nucleotidase C-terminal domain-containing protein [Polyangiaceae bacterium]